MSARPPGQRRSGRSAVRGEMSHAITSDLESEERGGGGRNEPPLSGLRAMMMKKQQGKQGGGGAPIRERTTPVHNRQRSLGFLRGNLRGQNNAADDDEYDSDDEQAVADAMQKDYLEHSLTTHMASKDDNQDDDGYDSDADIQPHITPDDPEFMDLDNHEHVRKNEKGEYKFDWEAMDWAALMKLKEEGYYDQVGDPTGRMRPPPEDEDADPLANTFEYDYYFRDITDVENPLLIKTTKPDSGAVLPLKAHGPGLDDFLLAVTDHPSKYAVLERKVNHADSKREPRPTFPKGRTVPSNEFVNKYKGYLFVTGLVPHLDSSTGEVQDFDDTLHKQSIAEDVAKLFGVTSMDVSPASATSAFVGFGTKLEAKKAMVDSASDGRLAVSHSVKLQKYEEKKSEGEDDEEIAMAKDEKEFVASSPAGADSILKVTGLPENATSAELFQSMFPPGSHLEGMFGSLTKDDFLRVSSTTALIKLASNDLVTKALKSNNISNNASVGVGKQSIQVLRAKRERVFDKWVGVARAFGQSKLGNRLFVTGDVPPHEMYLSHNDMLHLSGLPPNFSLDDLAVFFQPFSADRRDVLGSGHIVRCSRGLSTGCAYVGFELPGEIDHVTDLYNGKATIGGTDVTLRPVSDKKIRRGVREGARPARSAEELHADLYDWERHVDPKDIAELAELGIEKGVLDEIMITLRHHNRTFAAGDQSISGERLYQEVKVGNHYRNAVRKYLKVLKSCVGTKEEPGLMYEAMFSPDQEVDMGLFDIEEDRIREMRAKDI